MKFEIENFEFRFKFLTKYSLYSAPKYLNTFIVISNTKYRFFNSNRFDSSLIFFLVLKIVSVGWWWHMFTFKQIEKIQQIKIKSLKIKIKKFCAKFWDKAAASYLWKLFYVFVPGNDVLQFMIVWTISVSDVLTKMHFFLASSQVDVASCKKYTCFEKSLLLTVISLYFKEGVFKWGFYLVVPQLRKSYEL